MDQNYHYLELSDQNCSYLDKKDPIVITWNVRIKMKLPGTSGSNNHYLEHKDQNCHYQDLKDQIVVPGS